MKLGEQHGEADLNRINLAYILSDAQKIYVPSVNDNDSKGFIVEDYEPHKQDESNENSYNIMVNINIANKQELEKVPGIGEVTAKKIIEYRNENGKFNSIEDIKGVTGIGESKFNNIKDYICVK